MPWWVRYASPIRDATKVYCTSYCDLYFKGSCNTSPRDHEVAMFETGWDKYRLKCNYVVHRTHGSNVRLLSRAVYLRRNVVLVLHRIDSVVLVVWR